MKNDNLNFYMIVTANFNTDTRLFGESYCVPDCGIFADKKKAINKATEINLKKFTDRNKQTVRINIHEDPRNNEYYDCDIAKAAELFAKSDTTSAMCYDFNDIDVMCRVKKLKSQDADFVRQMTAQSYYDTVDGYTIDTVYNNSDKCFQTSINNMVINTTITQDEAREYHNTIVDLFSKTPQKKATIVYVVSQSEELEDCDDYRCSSYETTMVVDQVFSTRELAVNYINKQLSQYGDDYSSIFTIDEKIVDALN